MSESVEAKPSSKFYYTIHQESTTLESNSYVKSLIFIEFNGL